MTKFKSEWHWSCNGKRYDNKYKAISENIETGHPIRFNEPASYLNYDFSKNPLEEWNEMLKEWALELRQNFSYIRIWFSGGCDSMKMLEIFLQNKIFIDEICIIKSGIVDYDHELDDVAIPYINKVKHLIPNTKIDIRVANEHDMVFFYSNAYWFENLKATNTEPYLQATHILKDYNINHDTKIANLYGKDKPFIMYFQNQWWTYFLDSDVEPPTDDFGVKINFFIDNPLIHAKQSHMLKNAIMRLFKREDYNKVTHYTGEYQSIWNYGSGRIDSAFSFFIPKQLPNKTLTWNGETFHTTTEKEYRALSWMIEHSPDVVKKWKRSVDDFSQFADGKWFNEGRAEKGTIGVFSNFYSLDTGLIKTVDQLFPKGFYLPD